MTRKSLIVVALAVVVLLGVGGYMLLRTPAVVPQPRDRGSVTAIGRLEPEGAIVDVGATAGSRLDRFEGAIREGVRVKAGDVIGYLDTHAEASAARDYAASELEEARERRRAEDSSGQAAVDDATFGIRRAEQSLQLKYEAQEAETRRASAELEKLRGDLQRAEKLRVGNAILPGQYDATALAVRQGEEQLARNRATLAELKEERDIQLGATKAGLRAAEASRVRSQLSARVQTLTQALRLAEARLALTEIRAPLDGEILQIVTHPGEVIGNAPILRMGNTDQMVAIAEVYETDVRFVREGQKATVNSEALAGPVTGRVERVGRLISKSDVFGIDPTAEADARVIEVRVRLDPNTVTAGYNRHQVNVTIDTAGSGTSPAAAPVPPPGTSR